VLNIIDARCNREVYVQIWQASNVFFSKEQNCTFPGTDQRNSLSIVTINRNQASACDFHPTIVVRFGRGMLKHQILTQKHQTLTQKHQTLTQKHQTLTQNPPRGCLLRR